jgi:hypothetical protein
LEGIPEQVAMTAESMVGNMVEYLENNDTVEWKACLQAAEMVSKLVFETGDGKADMMAM